MAKSIALCRHHTTSNSRAHLQSHRQLVPDARVELFQLRPEVREPWVQPRVHGDGLLTRLPLTARLRGGEAARFTSALLPCPDGITDGGTFLVLGSASHPPHSPTPGRPFSTSAARASRARARALQKAAASPTRRGRPAAAQDPSAPRWSWRCGEGAALAPRPARGTGPPRMRIASEGPGPLRTRAGDAT